MSDEKKLPTDEELKNLSGQDDKGDVELDADGNPVLDADGNPKKKEQEKVTLTKDEHDKLIKERDDYRKRAIAKDDKDKKTPPKDEGKKEGDFLTRSDFYKHNETVAIKMAEGETKVDPDSFGMTAEQLAEIQEDIKANFDEMKKFYSPKSGKDTSEDIFNDLLDAHAAWRRRNPKKPADADAKARAELTKQRGNRGGSPDPKDQVQRPKVFKSKVPPSEWYKKPQ